MSCTNCFNGCGTPYPDTCVKYTGPDIPLLGLETGDPLSKVEESIINKLIDYSTGVGIDVSSLTIGCDFINDFIGCCTDHTLKVVLQALIDASCSLKTAVTAIEAIVLTPFSFTTTCLTLGANPTRDDILQAALVKICSMDTTLTAINNDYVKATDLNSLITQYLATNTSTQQSSKMVPFVAYEYYGPLSNFNGSGVGLTSAGFTKVYICNGSNGTPDKRGRVAVGAVNGVPGGALDAAVDPTLPANPGTNYTLLQRFGSSFITLNTSQIPAHSHPVVDSGHSHIITGSNATSFTSGGFCAAVGGGSGPENAGSTNISTTGISVGTAGGGQPHDNRQPSIAANFIMYIP